MTFLTHRCTPRHLPGDAQYRASSVTFRSGCESVEEKVPSQSTFLVGKSEILVSNRTTSISTRCKLASSHIMDDDIPREQLHLLEVEKMISETILGDTPSAEEIVPEAPLEPTKTANEDEEPEEPRVYTNEIAICNLMYHGQKKGVHPSDSVVIRCTSAAEFADQVYTLVKPLLKRGVYFPEPDQPCWMENELPTREEFPQFVQFKDNIQKRCWKLDSVDEYMLMKWANRLIYLQAYVHSSNVQSKAMWEQVQQELLGVQSDGKKTKEALEEERLQFVMKKLQKAHQASLIPRTDDAFKLWARLIMQQTSKDQRDRFFVKPPQELLEKFLVVENEKPKPEKRNRTISGPALRGHTQDGFGFQDEILALRQTVTQIKDLVEMLDKRVELLEEKSRGYNQTLEGIPLKKRKYDSDGDSDGEDDQKGMGAGNDERPIDVRLPLVRVEGNHGNPDPLVFEDIVVKEEYDEIESDG
nr:uncharacterized protein LOC115263172 isoform X2 [Aedes albopictus]